MAGWGAVAVSFGREILFKVDCGDTRVPWDRVLSGTCDMLAAKAILSRGIFSFDLIFENQRGLKAFPQPGPLLLGQNGVMGSDDTCLETNLPSQDIFEPMSISPPISVPKRGRGRPRKGTQVIHEINSSVSVPSSPSGKCYATRGRKSTPILSPRCPPPASSSDLISEVKARAALEGYSSRASKAWSLGRDLGLQFEGTDREAIEGLEEELRKIRPT